jgi:hypothetical protein
MADCEDSTAATNQQTSSQSWPRLIEADRPTTCAAEETTNKVPAVNKICIVKMHTLYSSTHCPQTAAHKKRHVQTLTHKPPTAGRALARSRRLARNCLDSIARRALDCLPNLTPAAEWARTRDSSEPQIEASGLSRRTQMLSWPCRAHCPKPYPAACQNAQRRDTSAKTRACIPKFRLSPIGLRHCSQLLHVRQSH